MTSKEFKKITHFRSTADRNCYNCKYCTYELNQSVDPYGNLSPRKYYCIHDLLDDGKCSFVISNFMICDNWVRNKNKNCLSIV